MSEELESSSSSTDIAVTMAMILGTMVAVIAALTTVQTPQTKNKTTSNNNNNDNNIDNTWMTFLDSFLPNPTTEPSKRAYELFTLMYTPIWIFAFGIIVAFGLYETFDEWSYMKVCVGLALPFLLQPIILPSGGIVSGGSPDQYRPLLERYSFKANVWIAIYSFIGNYWYTHYFYSVLKAKYTMPAHRLNNVPIALFFATHFYFSTYHAFSNALLRKVVTTYEPGMLRHVLFGTVILVFSYFTAFMETLTISSYPDYSFEDRDMAYTVGSAFYGIYFLVSFPAFFALDCHIDNNNNNNNNNNNKTTGNTTSDGTGKAMTAWDTVVSSCGYGMMILCLLDFVRLWFDIPLVVGSSNVVCSMVQ